MSTHTRPQKMTRNPITVELQVVMFGTWYVKGKKNPIGYNGILNRMAGCLVFFGRNDNHTVSAFVAIGRCSVFAF